MIEAIPTVLISDRAYDSYDLDDNLRGKGIKLVSPHNKNRKKPKTQDGRELRRHKRRRVVERFFSWIKNKHRLFNRWQRYPENFLALCRFMPLFKC